MNELLTALQKLVKHNEGLNHAFYVIGKPSAMRQAMAGQKDLLNEARAAISKAELELMANDPAVIDETARRMLERGVI